MTMCVTKAIYQLPYAACYQNMLQVKCGCQLLGRPGGAAEVIPLSVG